MFTFRFRNIRNIIVTLISIALIGCANFSVFAAAPDLIQPLVFDEDTGDNSNALVQTPIGPNGEFGMTITNDLPAASLSFVRAFSYKWCEDATADNCTNWANAVQITGSGVGPNTAHYAVSGSFVEGIVLVRFASNGRDIQPLVFDEDTTSSSNTLVETPIGPNGEFGMTITNDLPAASLSFVRAFSYKWCEDATADNCTNWANAVQITGSGVGPNTAHYAVSGSFVEGIVLVRFGAAASNNNGGGNGNGNGGGTNNDDLIEQNNAANVTWSYTDGYYPSDACAANPSASTCRSFSAIQPVNRAFCPTGAICGNVGVVIPGNYSTARAALLANMPAGNQFIGWLPSNGY